MPVNRFMSELSNTSSVLNPLGGSERGSGVSVVVGRNRGGFPFKILV